MNAVVNRLLATKKALQRAFFHNVVIYIMLSLL